MSGDNKKLLSKSYFYFFSCLIFWSTALPVFAQSTEKPFLTWLPLVTSKVQLIQPDNHCPQNKIVNIQLHKKNHQVDADIGSVTWDVSCKVAQPSVAQPLSQAEQKAFIESQIERLVQQLRLFPETNIRIKSVNLNLAKNSVIFSAYLKKTKNNLFITLLGEQLNVKIKLNLVNQHLTLEGTLRLKQLAKFISLPEQLISLLDTQLIVSYQSDLQHWEEGAFTVNSQGKLSGFAEQFDLTIAGNLAPLAAQLNLQEMHLNIQATGYKITVQQAWQPTDIKLNLAQPAIINLSPFSINSFPLELRIGHSVLYSEVWQGKKRQIKEQKLPALFATINVQGELDNMVIPWRLLLLKQTLVGKLWVTGNNLKVQLPSTTLVVKELVHSLREYLPALQLVAIDSGDLSLQLSADYNLDNKIANIKSTINGNNISGKDDSVLFSGVSLSSELDYQFAPQQLLIKQDKQQLRIANLFIGVPLTNITLNGQLNGGEAVIEHFKTQLLGGQLQFSHLQLQPPSQTIINIVGLSLPEMIKYSAYPEINSAGVIAGRLPLLLTAQGPVIKKGDVFASHNGYIKVSENTVVKTMSRDNPAFSFTMQALSELQFTTLRGVLDYEADGETALQVEIKGISPNLSKTRPVIFNYTHDENIKKLLQSLRFDEQLNKKIEERY